MSGSVVHKMADSILHLMLVHFICNIRTGPACDALIEHDLHGIRHNPPYFVAPWIGRQDLVVAIKFASTSADRNAAGDLKRVTFFDFVVMELIGMGISGSDSGSRFDVHNNPDGSMRPAVALDILHDQIDTIFLRSGSNLIVV